MSELNTTMAALTISQMHTLSGAMVHSSASTTADDRTTAVT